MVMMTSGYVCKKKFDGMVDCFATVRIGIKVMIEAVNGW